MLEPPTITHADASRATPWREDVWVELCADSRFQGINTPLVLPQRTGTHHRRKETQGVVYKVGANVTSVAPGDWVWFRKLDSKTGDELKDHVRIGDAWFAVVPQGNVMMKREGE